MSVKCIAWHATYSAALMDMDDGYDDLRKQKKLRLDISYGPVTSLRTNDLVFVEDDAHPFKILAYLRSSYLFLNKVHVYLPDVVETSICGRHLSDILEVPWIVNDPRISESAYTYLDDLWRCYRLDKPPLFPMKYSKNQNSNMKPVYRLEKDYCMSRYVLCPVKF